MQIEPVMTIDEYGTKRWKLNDKFHRTDGPAVEFADGDREWYLNGKRHRTDGPAIKYANGDEYWNLNGKRHRTDGPAVELSIGYREWWLNGIEYSFEEWLGLTPLSDQEKVKLRFKYATE